MTITYYGTSCFKIQSGELVIVFDPPSKESDVKSPRFQANLVLSSHNHPRHNGIDTLSSKTDEPPFVITGPGEYEVKKVYIKGIPSFHDSLQGKKYGINTIYVVGIEGLNVCHLGDFGEKELRSETEAEIGKVDILFVPIGGESVLEPASASQIINQISPRLVVPMHYELAKSKKANLLTDFFSEMGVEKIKPIDKLSLRQKDISEDEETKIIALESLLTN